MCDAQPSARRGEAWPERHRADEQPARCRHNGGRGRPAHFNTIEAKNGVPSRSDRASAACASSSALSFSPRASIEAGHIAPHRGKRSVWCCTPAVHCGTWGSLGRMVENSERRPACAPSAVPGGSVGSPRALVGPLNRRVHPARGSGRPGLRPRRGNRGSRKPAQREISCQPIERQNRRRPTRRDSRNKRPCAFPPETAPVLLHSLLLSECGAVPG